MPPLIPTPESVELARIADELARVANAHAQISVDFTRWVDSQLSYDAVNLQLIQIQLELAQKSLELLNSSQAGPGAIPPPIIP